MTTSEVKLYYVPYDVLREDKDTPKSFFGFLWWFLRSIGRGIVKGFPKNLLIPLIFMLVYTLLNMVYMGMVNDTMYIPDGSKSILAYIFSGVIPARGSHTTSVRGFDLFHSEITSIYWTIPMLFLFSGLILNIFSRIRQNSFKKFISDITSAEETARLYAQASTKSISSFILLGCFWGSIIGFFLQSPIILFLLPVTLFLSFTLREKGKIIGLVSMFFIAINIEKRNPKYVNIANIALSILGLAFGFAFYFCIAIILWRIFNYTILARIIFTVIIAVSSFLLYRTRKNQPKSSTASNVMIMMISAFGIFVSTSLVVYADDGGWAESGRNLVGWLSNPGTKILAALGLEGSVGVALGWIGNTALGGILPALGLGEALQGAQVLCGAGSPKGMGFAALDAALGPLGPLGSAIGDAWSSSIDALGGAEGGSPGGDLGSGSSSSNSGGNSSGNGSNSGARYEDIKKKDSRN